MAKNQLKRLELEEERFNGRCLTSTSSCCRLRNEISLVTQECQVFALLYAININFYGHFSRVHILNDPQPAASASELVAVTHLIDPIAPTPPPTVLTTHHSPWLAATKNTAI